MLDQRGVPLGILEGNLIFVRRDGSVMAVPIDLSRVTARGEPVAIESGVRVHANGSVEASLARNGTLLYATGSVTSRLVLVALDGTSRALFSEPHQFGSPRFSPDGKRVALNRADASSSEIWIYDLEARSPRRLTAEGGQNDRPEWSPDGTRILYRTSRMGPNKFYWQAENGTDSARALLSLTGVVADAQLTPDGTQVIFRTQRSRSGMDILSAPVLGTQQPTGIAATRFDEYMPRLSRDGRWLAYVSNVAGPLDVYVQPPTASAERFPVSVGGGTEPRWAPDGRTIYYRGNRHIIAAHVTTSPTFSVTSRDTLFDDRFEHDPFKADWDISPDGKHFLMLEPADNNQQIVVVLNWARVVRERMKPR
jgi:Tol biopolymer transport system component